MGNHKANAAVQTAPARTESLVHTPGPWEAKRIPGGAVVKQCGGHGKYLFNLEECPGIPEAPANVSVVVAGPDMLATLRKTLAFLKREDDADDMAEVMQAIEDVIQTATEG